MDAQTGVYAVSAENRTDDQPGDAEQLARTVVAAERYYESSRQGIVVYWDDQAKRYRMGYLSIYKPTKETMEVLRIPR
jgi:hypothetical protein